MTNETGAPGVVKCGICRHEMVQCDNGGFVCDHCCHEYDETCECAACLGLRINDRNEAELAALKSAPGMAEIDEILKRALSPDCNGDSTFQALYRDNLADLARRFAASREEVVGLLKWLWKIIVCNGQILAYIRRCDKPEAKAILEIVEGK